jgi:hypothetical protein
MISNHNDPLELDACLTHTHMSTFIGSSTTIWSLQGPPGRSGLYYNCFIHSLIPLHALYHLSLPINAHTVAAHHHFHPQIAGPSSPIALGGRVDHAATLSTTRRRPCFPTSLIPSYLQPRTSYLTYQAPEDVFIPPRVAFECKSLIASTPRFGLGKFSVIDSLFLTLS